MFHTLDMQYFNEQFCILKFQH